MQFLGVAASANMCGSIQQQLQGICCKNVAGTASGISSLTQPLTQLTRTCNRPWTLKQIAPTEQALWVCNSAHLALSWSRAAAGARLQHCQQGRYRTAG